MNSFLITALPAGEVDTRARDARRAGRQLSVRAYDGEAMMLDAAVLAGQRFAERVPELLDEAAQSSSA